MTFLAVLALVLSPTTVVASEPCVAVPTLTVETRGGAVRAADARGVHVLAREAARTCFGGYVYLQLGYGDRARLSIDGGQVDLCGPAVVEWSPDAPARLLLHEARAAELVAGSRALRVEWRDWAFELVGGAVALSNERQALRTRVHAARSFRVRRGTEPTLAVASGATYLARPRGVGLPADGRR